MGDNVDRSVGIDSDEYVWVQRGMVDLGVPGRPSACERIGKKFYAKHKRTAEATPFRNPRLLTFSIALMPSPPPRI